LNWVLDPCSAATALTCFGDDNNADISLSQQLPSAPGTHELGLFVCPTDDGVAMGFHTNKPESQRYNDIFIELLKESWDKADELCDECCPDGVTIHIKPKGIKKHWCLSKKDKRNLPPQIDEFIECKNLTRGKRNQFITKVSDKWKNKSK
jgi:hypothetical protein